MKRRFKPHTFYDSHKKMSESVHGYEVSPEFGNVSRHSNLVLWFSFSPRYEQSVMLHYLNN